MTLAQETEMSATEIDEFLGRNETGVLSLARDEQPYAIPISYGYDTSERTFYLRLVSTPESEKRSFLDSSPEGRIVVYEESTEKRTYWSVVAEGALEEIAPSSMSVDQIVQYGQAKPPLFEIWGTGKDELDIQLYELSPDKLSGRRTDIEIDGEGEVETDF